MEQTNKKPNHTRLLKAVVIFLTVSILLFCTGMTMLSWNFKKLDLNTYTAKSWTGSSGAPITDVELRISDHNITINKISDNSEPSITWWDSDTDKITVSFSEGKLTVKSKYTFKFNAMFSFVSSDKKAVVINLPDELFANLIIRQSDGKLTINNIKAINTDIQIRDARTTLNNFETANAKIKVSDGRLILNNFIVDSCNFTISDGKATGNIAGVKADYTITVDKSDSHCNLVAQTGITNKKISVKLRDARLNLTFTN